MCIKKKKIKKMNSNSCSLKGFLVALKKLIVYRRTLPLLLWSTAQCENYRQCIQIREELFLMEKVYILMSKNLNQSLKGLKINTIYFLKKVKVNTLPEVTGITM